MARENAPEEPTVGVPVWFMTYSDVITLLMTFFILLLTFATNEPEHFERMQASMFGGGDGTGIAGKSNIPLDMDAIVARYRPRSSRVTIRGSETPPRDTDHVSKSLAKGLEGLSSHRFDADSSYAIDMKLSHLIRDGELSSTGQQRLRMLAMHLAHGSSTAVMGVSDPQALSDAILLVDRLSAMGVAPGKLAVSIIGAPDHTGTLSIELIHESSK